MDVLCVNVYPSNIMTIFDLRWGSARVQKVYFKCDNRTRFHIKVRFTWY